MIVVTGGGIMNCKQCNTQNDTSAHHCSNCGSSFANDKREQIVKEASKKTEISLKGYNGTVDYDGQTIKISRKGAMGFFTQGLRGQKEISVRALTSVQFKKAGLLTNGYIQFATGAGENKGGLQAAVTDENSVIFTLSSNEEFEALKDQISEKMNNPTQAHNNSTSNAEQLEKIANLFEKGLLTEAEFLLEKSKIIGADREKTEK